MTSKLEPNSWSPPGPWIHMPKADHDQILAKIDDLQTELAAADRRISELEQLAGRLLEVIVLDPGALTYGLKRRKAIEDAGDAGITW